VTYEIEARATGGSLDEPFLSRFSPSPLSLRDKTYAILDIHLTQDVGAREQGCIYPWCT
jgi:hypothetical protein